MTMVKNPFDGVPPIAETPSAESGRPAPDYVQEVNQVTKGTPPKTLLSGISKFGIPIAGIGIGIWLCLPDTGRPHHTQEKPIVVVDPSQQIAATSSLLDQLKADASKAPAPAPVANPAQPGMPPVAGAAQRQATGPGQPSAPGQHAQTGQPSMPTPVAAGAYQTGARPVGGYPSQGGIDPMQALAEARMKREEEIRASPMEVSGSIKLLGDATNATVATKTTAAQQLQAELAAINAKKDAATAGLDPSKLLAGLAPQPAAKPKNASEEFLSSKGSAASSNTVLIQQAPASQIMIEQGTTIRAVLISSVTSDLPGQITALVTSDVYDSISHRYVLIPKGSRLLGAYNSEVIVGQESLLIAMTRLILPNGNWISLAGASASNMLGQSGMKADVNNHFFKMFSTSFILGASSLFL